MSVDAATVVPEGKWTNTIYTMMKEGKHAEVIQILAPQLQNFPNNRAALSLMAYCRYYLQEFAEAANW